MAEINFSLKKIIQNKGFGLLEVVVTIGIVTIFLLGIIQLLNFSLTNVRNNENQSQATNLATEAIEITRQVRDMDWSSFSSLDTDNPLHPAYGMEWSLTANCDTVDIYTRCIDLDRVYRDDVTGDLVESGGTEDSDSRKVKATISWTERGDTKSVEIQTFLTNWK